MTLNKEVYTVNKDNLVYDSSHPIDAKNMPVTVTAGTVGIIRRGQVLDFVEGKYKLHESSGTVSAIVAETISYTAEDTIVAVPAYISGTFRKSACITETELTDSNIEEFRSKGIYLK